MTSVQLAPDPTGRTPESRAARVADLRAPEAPGAASPQDGPDSRHILGMRVDATSYAETTDAVADRAQAGAGGMVCVATVHMVMEAFDEAAFRSVVNSADRVTPDGVPLVAALRSLGVPDAQRVYGPSLMPIVCERAEAFGLRVGFYGGTPAVLTAMTGALTMRFPKLDVGFAWAPPFRSLTDAEDADVIAAITAAEVKILFVGLGCPKQERWMAAHREALGCTMLGVGAAFDFIAGAKRQAPAWMQRSGLEWLFRLSTEPRRLWRRYLIGNPRFLFHFARQLRRWRAANGATAPIEV
jgi:N-acetylglucosaminyldiphosphoundecaprenol N-acetyl-beta-D-mannosaminyltransferase